MHFTFSASVQRLIRRDALFAAFSNMAGIDQMMINRYEHPLVNSAQQNNGVSVLLVDDNAVNQQVAAAILQKQGFMVDIANDGAQALMLFRSKRYSVVLMDCQMPIMDGFESTINMRLYETEEGYPRTPIVALTANASDEDRQACFEAGMDDFLVKPMRIKAVIDVFSHYLKTDETISNKVNDETTWLTDDIDQHFDLSILSDLEDILDKSQLSEVITLFLENSTTRISELHSSFNDMDLDRIEKTAHSLKGSSSNLAAKKLSRMCGNIVDKIRRNETLVNTDSLMIEIENEFHYVKDFLLKK